MTKILLLLILILSTGLAEASLQCRDLLKGNFKTKVDLYDDFDPVAAFKQAGIPPRSINFKVTNRPAGYKEAEETTLDFKLFSGKSALGGLDMYETSDREWTTQSGLIAAEEGRGIGGLMYLIGAEIIFRLYPDTESIISFEGSPEANFMWEKLVRTGHAKKTPKYPKEPDLGWNYEIERQHITPKLSEFISQRRISGVTAEWRKVIKKQE